MVRANSLSSNHSNPWEDDPHPNPNRYAVSSTAGTLTQSDPSSSRKPIERFLLAGLREKYPRLHPPVVHGLFREGETANVISTSKVGKSWLMYDLALSIITGEPWLGEFETSPGGVILIDNELHRPTISHRVHTVAEAKGLKPDEYQYDLEVWPLRGDLRSLIDLGIEFDAIEPGSVKAIILDAKYRFVVEGKSENDNAAETQLYNLLDHFALQTGAAFVLVHHSSKGSQTEKRVTDVGAGAGAQSRAADCHLVLREHEDPKCVVLDAAVRSFAPVEPMVLRWCFPLWRPDDDMNPDELKGKKTGGERRADEKDRTDMLIIVDVLRNWDSEVDGPAAPNAIITKAPLGKDRTRTVLAKLLHNGTVTRSPITRRGNPTHEYALVEPTED